MVEAIAAATAILMALAELVVEFAIFVVACIYAYRLIRDALRQRDLVLAPV